MSPRRADPDQARAALEKATRVYRARAALRREIKAGRVTVEEVLADVPEYAERMEICKLLTAQHRWGSKRVRSFLRERAVNENRPLGKLTARQRWVIASAIQVKREPEGKRKAA